MAPRPLHVDIGPHRYAVCWDEAAIDRLRVERDEAKLAGLIHYAGLKITVDPRQGKTHQRRALLHEVVHGILDVTGWNSVGPEKPDADDFIVRIDSMLLDTLRRNPALVAWLTEPDAS
jgi:hypothetical protein